MKKIMKNKKLLAFSVMCLFVLGACGYGHVPQAAKAQQNLAAQQGDHTKSLHDRQPAYFPQFSSEIRNINERNARYDNPNLIGYVTVMTQQGGIIYSGTIKGKVSSTDSQVTPKDAVDCEHWPNNDPRPDGCGVVSIADPDGSWSTNGGGLFWYDAQDHIHEFYGPAIVSYSDVPQVFSTPPILTINAQAQVQNACDAQGNNCTHK